MSTPVTHRTFTLERTYPADAARVFKALSDPKKKRRWFAEGEGFVVDSYTLDFKVGGFERTHFRFGDGPPMTNDNVYLDIVENERLVFAYAMTVGGAPLSSSLASMELVPSGSGTLLRFTETTAFLDGKDGSADRKEGTRELLEALARELEQHG
ncbi:SRPBCC family protein [Myxococcus sp. K38C18041901]|uniref:SRPBCC family protein n=1 Tax=Myxococcus guangdongensis TaxID=2906760 RepID=UPI0020A79D92|nr:SRPBCC family protein [Myxococcus guangdongensis]MCP3065046.1 SRPBCC family protein [Myxococcus guangdongensis]